jgi:hypothetical protein
MCEDSSDLTLLKKLNWSPEEQQARQGKRKPRGSERVWQRMTAEAARTAL